MVGWLKSKHTGEKLEYQGFVPMHCTCLMPSLLLGSMVFASSASMVDHILA